MAGHVQNRRPKFQTNTRPKQLKRKREQEDLEVLTKKVSDFNSKPLTAPQTFAELPLSQATQDGLKASHFQTLTSIQSQAIPVALKGGDVLGAAKTGSGKTLAFLVPVLENLYRKQWTEFDGLGALILSPTRELAIQIFEVLRKVGRNHTFSAGLVIGGKSLEEERGRLGRMNILVATPGRIQQHLDQTAEFEVGNLQMLVLDEADRIMDMGFSATVDAIVEHLPAQRQTLLFSATQTKKISDLTRLALSEPDFVSVHEAADSATPSGLQQNYVVTPLPEKFDVLWSFIRANVKKKLLIFLSSGKQVRFIYEAFRHLQPGVPLLHLHGRQKQTVRLDITKKFSNSKNACLFATDVAARGLDFPAVDWVVQVDCPEDADTYIHRVGRTARYEHEGRAILFVDPSEEEGMLNALKRKKVEVEKINVRQKKMQNTIRNQLQNMCFKDPELKYLGQKAFVSYVRSVYIQKDKDVFDVKKLDLEDFAASLGLPGAPKVKFVKGEDAKARKNMPRALRYLSSGSEDDEDPENPNDKTKPAVRTKYDRMFERQNQNIFADHYTKLIEDENDDLGRDQTADLDDEDNNDFLSIKRRFEAGDVGLDQQLDDDTSSAAASSSDTDEEGDVEKDSSKTDGIKKQKNKIDKPQTIHLSTNPSDPGLIVDSNRRSKLLKSKKALLKYKGHGSHLHFAEDDDTPYTKEYYEREEEFTKKGDEGARAEREKFLAEEREKAAVADEVDKEVARQKKREKRDRRKERERAEAEGDVGGEDGGVDEVGVQLAPYEEDEEGGSLGGDGQDEEGPVRDKSKKKDKKEKRPKKWFEDPSSDEDEGGDEAGRKSKKRRKQGKRDDSDVDEPQTLEDLEAIASGLLK